MPNTTNIIPKYLYGEVIIFFMGRIKCKSNDTNINNQKYVGGKNLLFIIKKTILIIRLFSDNTK
jgi:hypothetical protein